MLRAHSFPISAVSKRPLLATENTFSQDMVFPSREPKRAKQEFCIFLHLDLTPLTSIQSIQIVQNNFPLPPTSLQVASMAQRPHSFVSPSDHIKWGLALSLVHQVPQRPRRMGLSQPWCDATISTRGFRGRKRHGIFSAHCPLARTLIYPCPLHGRAFGEHHGFSATTGTHFFTDALLSAFQTHQVLSDLCAFAPTALRENALVLHLTGLAQMPPP